VPNSLSKIRFRAKLLRPLATGKSLSRAFVMVPKSVSAKLPSRSKTTVDGRINGVPFRATLEPDGQSGHWLKLNSRLREAAGAETSEVVTLEIAPVGKEPPPRMPVDLSQALAAVPAARAVWSDLTSIARRDWIHWIKSAKLAETRARRIRNTCDMLTSGKRRVCCFDRSGIYSKGFSAPKAAPDRHGQ